jgi:regulator of RNase E activity RraA
MDDVLPVSGARSAVGRARTLTYAPRAGARRSLSMYAAMQACEPGDILVVATGTTRSWLLGENMAHFAMYNELGAIVTDGRNRDANDIRALQFPVFSRGFAVRPPTADLELILADGPVNCGGAQIWPGDLLVADADGVVVVPHAAAEALIGHCGSSES